MVALTSMTEDELINLLRRHCAPWGARKEFAKQAGVSAAFLSQVIAEHRRLPESLVKALGYRRVVTYERIPGREAPAPIKNRR